MKKISKMLKIPYSAVQYTITHYSNDVKNTHCKNVSELEVALKEE